MTEGQFEVRRQRAERDVFVISTYEDGWRVRSTRNPSKFYLVSMNGTGLRCTCPDFENNSAQDPSWQCKHVLAVQDQQAKTGAIVPHTERELAEERAAVQAEGSPHQPENDDTHPAQMLIKRSISPDGRIDSISIEFSSLVDEALISDIKSRALNTLKLQTEIVKGFFNGSAAKTNTGKAVQPQAHNGNGAMFARLLDVGVSNGQYGERFFLNVQVNGRTARFFGSTAQIAKAISAVGEEFFPTDIEPGLRLNLPCHVLTEKSRDGRYLNVTQVLPLPRHANGGGRQ